MTQFYAILKVIGNKGSASVWIQKTLGTWTAMLFEYTGCGQAVHSSPGNSSAQRDVEQAHTQAPLSGVNSGVPSWARLPKELWPPEFHAHADPGGERRVRRRVGETTGEERGRQKGRYRAPSGSRTAT